MKITIDDVKLCNIHQGNLLWGIYNFSIATQISAFFKVHSVQKACTKCFVIHLLKFEILQTTWKNVMKNIKMKNLLLKNWKLRVWFSLFNFFLCDLQDFKFQYGNHKAFGANFLYWVDFEKARPTTTVSFSVFLYISSKA